jgi:hypothetical protein
MSITSPRNCILKCCENIYGQHCVAIGKRKVVAARYVHNDRLIDALMSQAFAALNASPGARAEATAPARGEDG